MSCSAMQGLKIACVEVGGEWKETGTVKQRFEMKQKRCCSASEVRRLSIEY
jgi:hypothetical protein